MPWNKPYVPPKNQRLAPELYTDANRIYFITIRAFGDQSPFVRAELNKRVLDVLREEQDRQNCAVYTYSLMPNHLHYLVSPRQDSISVLTFTDRYRGKVTNQSWTLGWRGKLWQPRFFDHIVRTDESLIAIAEYILGNPVRKRLVEHAEDWPWSGHMNPLPIWP
jgi:putative transposase